MARIINNEKGFDIISLTPEEAFGIGFGFQDELVCDGCNDYIAEEKELYYIAVLNMCFCKKCFLEWYKVAIRYEEDMPAENEWFNDVLERIKEKYSVTEIDIKELTK